MYFGVGNKLYFNYIILSLIKETETHVKFASAMETVQTKIFAGKLGDLTLRVGRYKENSHF